MGSPDPPAFRCVTTGPYTDGERFDVEPELYGMSHAMPKFMGIHTLPPGGFTAEQVQQLAQAAQQDPVVKGYRSFCSLAEGKAVCILEAPDKESVAAWFQKMGMPTDSITALELEGERGVVQQA